MKHREIEFSVAHIGFGRQLWRWSASLSGISIHGQAVAKREAIEEAERAIDRALAPNKVRLIRPAPGLSQATHRENNNHRKPSE
jgi:hypothetical protein